MLVIRNEGDLKRAIKRKKHSSKSHRPIKALSTDYLIGLNDGIAHRQKEHDAFHAIGEQLASEKKAWR